MLELLIYTVTLLLLICGLFFVCYILFNKLIMPEDSRSCFAVVAGYPDDELLCEKVYYAFVQINLMNFSALNEVVVIDFGVSDEMKAKCFETVSKKAALSFCKICELEDKMIETEKQL